MPFYDYHCPVNGRTVEVKHKIGIKLKTWEEVCKAADIEPGDTPLNSSVERIIAAPQVSSPTSDSKLKELGFTKLVKRDKGVYEDVTSTDKDRRIVKSDDPSTFPDFKKKGLD